MKHVTVFALSALLLSVPLVMGCGGSDDPCALAAEHVKACTGLEGQAPATCNPDRASFLLSVPCSELSAARGTFVSSGFDPWGWIGGFDDGDNDLALGGGETSDWFKSWGWDGGSIAHNPGGDGWGGLGGLFGSGDVQTAKRITYHCEVRKEGWFKTSYYCVPSESMWSVFGPNCSGSGFASETKLSGVDNFKDCERQCNNKSFNTMCDG